MDSNVWSTVITFPGHCKAPRGYPEQLCKSLSPSIPAGSFSWIVQLANHVWNNSGSVVNGGFNLEYKCYIAIFVFSNQTSLFKAVTLDIFSVTHCCVVALMCKVPAGLFIINGYLCEIQSLVHRPKLHLDFDEAQFYYQFFTLASVVSDGVDEVIVVFFLFTWPLSCLWFNQPLHPSLHSASRSSLTSRLFWYLVPQWWNGLPSSVRAGGNLDVRSYFVRIGLSCIAAWLCLSL